MYTEAPGLHPGPRVMTRAQAHRDRAMLSLVHFPLFTFCLRQAIWAGIMRAI